uniref:ZPR1 zinc finger n=1 Tax=Neogobius melanostomus TaxID=47308 RepID=A0A8C6SI30_9GOBI
MSGINEAGVRGGDVIKDIGTDDDWQPTVIESLCMNCHQNGTTRLLLTRIPFFREIIVSSFSCDHCHWSNTEIQSAGEIQEQGICYTLKIKTKQDLNREVVKADSATTRIPELDFEIPPFTQKGSLSTIEGLLERAVSGLEQEQPARREADPEVAARIDEFIKKLQELKDVEEEFTLVIEDPSGNSFVENPMAPQKDEALTVTRFKRTIEQDKQLGIRADDDDGENENDGEEPAGNDLETMREVIIMATNCDSCGHRTNEVKSGGATEKQGTKITLHITDASDMTRDVLKSETCAVLIPELEFELGMGGLGGKFTTLEGLLKDVKDLIVDNNPFVSGDSGVSDKVQKINEFGAKIEKIIAGELDVHIILDDSAGNSYLQNVYAPEPDPEMTIEKYTRTLEQNEDLGLNDMKTEGYEQEN